MRIVLDFDGTLFVREGTKVREPVPKAVEYVRRLKEDGHQLVVSSGRANRVVHGEVDRAAAIKEMEFALQRYALSVDEIDYGNEGKMLGDLYVDDRAVGAPVMWWRGQYVIDWPLCYELIRDAVRRRTMLTALPR